MGIGITGTPPQADGYSAGLNSNGEIQTDKTQYHALNDLRITTLETNASLENQTDNFADKFTDSNGIRNTVDLVNTTSDYLTDAEQYSNLVDGSNVNGWTQTTGSSTATVVTTELTVKQKCYFSNVHASRGTATSLTFKCEIIQNGEVLAAKTQTDTYDFAFSLSDYTAPLDPGVCYLKFTRTTGTGVIYRTNNATGTIDNDYYTLVRDGNELAGSGGFKAFVMTLLVASDKDIVLNYDKAKPTEVFLDLFSGTMTDRSNVGSTTTFELKNSSTSDTTGELDPLDVHALNLTDDPDQLIIHQKSTSESTISKLILAISDV